MRCVQYFKDTNRKQFTTNRSAVGLKTGLCSIFQRYKSKAIHNDKMDVLKCSLVVFNISKIQIESNSQLPRNSYECGYSCVQYFKDTNRKQFTTLLCTCMEKLELCSIFQRYKSKAIHNLFLYVRSKVAVVFNISKIQIESNSQLCVTACITISSCVQYFKDTNRKQFTTRYTVPVIIHQLCSIFQRYKSKAIHNSVSPPASLSAVVFNISKIQIESNSQQFFPWLHCYFSCVQYFKDTNRKQFTTCLHMLTYFGQLCSIFQRYKSKAIHNRLRSSIQG